MVNIIILYNSEWINQSNEYKFNALATKGIMVHLISTYSPLLENVTQTIRIGIS